MRRSYWSCQLGGWGVYALLNTLVASPGHHGAALTRWALGSAVCSAVGLLVSHGMRALFRARRWTEAGLRVVPAVVALCAVGGVVVLQGTLLINSSLGLMSRRLWRDEQLVLALNLGATLLIWSGFYFGYHHFHRARQAREAALRAELTAQRTQLDLLRSQLNPHFVFNCLNSVRALISEDPARAQEAVTGLAALLRYTLAADRMTTVTLDEELAVVADYLRLEGIRYEERLQVSLDVEPAARQAAIPPMLVQTLVENAIKHGVAQSAGGGTVRLRARCEGPALVIAVANPGELGTGDGVGLANARQRLRLLYGDGAALTLRSHDGEVTAEVRLPRS
jgi:two-component system sensor histidine kinase AlgZ